jgi:type III secretory pathway lipoprotein EscJ
MGIIILELDTNEPDEAEKIKDEIKKNIPTDISSLIINISWLQWPEKEQDIKHLIKSTIDSLNEDKLNEKMLDSSDLEFIKLIEELKEIGLHRVDILKEIATNKTVMGPVKFWMQIIAYRLLNESYDQILHSVYEIHPFEVLEDE